MNRKVGCALGCGCLGLLFCIALALVGLYWLLIAVGDSTPAEHRDAMAKDIKRGMSRAEIGFTAASLGGKVVKNPANAHADYVQFFGSPYILVTFAGAHSCIDQFTLYLTYSSAQTLQTAKTVNARFCNVNGVNTEM